MYCPACGKKNEDNAVQCVGCGQNLSAGAPMQTVQAVPPGARPDIPTYLAQSIIVTLLCCLPCGIVAIVYSAQVNGKISAGDIAGAMDCSKKAKMWGWIAFGLGLAAILVQVLLTLAGAGFAAASNSSY